MKQQQHKLFNYKPFIGSRILNDDRGRGPFRNCVVFLGGFWDLPSKNDLIIEQIMIYHKAGYNPNQYLFTFQVRILLFLKPLRSYFETTQLMDGPKVVVKSEANFLSLKKAPIAFFQFSRMYLTITAWFFSLSEIQAF